MKFLKCQARDFKQANKQGKNYHSRLAGLKRIPQINKIDHHKDGFWVECFHNPCGEWFTPTTRRNLFAIDNGYLSGYGDYIKARKTGNKLIILEGEHKWRTFQVS